MKVSNFRKQNKTERINVNKFNNLIGRGGRARTCDNRFWRANLSSRNQIVGRKRGVKPAPLPQVLSQVLSNLHVAERDDGLFEIVPAGSGPFPTRSFAEGVAARLALVAL